jgi:glycosyltransferase involved in cell wall biosynthesis
VRESNTAEAAATSPLTAAAVPAPVAQPTRPPGVLQVLPSLVTGGVERGTVDVAKALVGAGWKAYVASAGGPMVRELERVGAVHFRLPLDSKNPLTIIANIGRLGRLLATYPIDLVHARSRAPAWSARVAARRHGVPFVTTFHGTYNATNFFKRYYNSIMTSGERVIAISDFIGEHVQANYGVPPDRVAVIHRGLDLDRMDPAKVPAERVAKLAAAWRLQDGVPVILMPGRLTRWKGQMVMIEATAKLVAELGKEAVVCVMVGDDQGRHGYRRQLERAIAAHGLGGAVRLTGECKDMAAAYMLADVVVSASLDPEAFGRVVVEAQAMGRPVIATDHGGPRETVLASRTGWLVPPGDADALASALKTVLSLRPQDRQTLALAARANVAERFTVERMCARTIGVYTELLAKKLAG